jgi:hypothetical protein
VLEELILPGYEEKFILDNDCCDRSLNSGSSGLLLVESRVYSLQFANLF